MSRKTKPSKQSPKSKPSVAIIGSGRLGTALAMALARAGYPVRILVALHKASALRAAKIVSAQTESASIKQVVSYGDRRFAALAEAAVVVFATPDDAIQKVATHLAPLLMASASTSRSRKVALHTSGARGSDALQPLRAAGFAVGSMHPLISISDPASGAEWLSKAFFSVEGDARAVQFAQRIVGDLGANAFRISPQDKALYHAAAVMASPNLTALFDLALTMLAQCGVSRKRARQVLLPLVQSTVANLETQDPATALTGPFKRGDVSTAAKHIKAMDNAHLTEALATYLALARHSLALAKNVPNRDEVLHLLERAASLRNPQ